MPQHQGNVNFQQYQANQQNNPWAKNNPSSYDMLMMRTQQNVSTGMPRNEAEARAAQEILAVQKAGGHPMGMINETEATNNEISGSRQAHDAMQLQEQEKAATKQQFDNTITDFNKWLMQQGKPPMPAPRQPNNRGWEGATEALQQLQKLQLPVIKY